MTNQPPNENFEETLAEAQSYLPRMEQEHNVGRLRTAMNERVENYQDDNPFSGLAGSYDINIPVDEATAQRIAQVQNKIARVIAEEDPDIIFRMTPTLYNKVFVFNKEDQKERPVKLPRLTKKFSDSAKKEIQALTTLYPKPQIEGAKTRVEICMDPVSILRKASSRSWAHESCERLGAPYDQGLFSDTANNNAIAYVYIEGNDQPAARVMMRWCVDDMDKANVGIEPIVYPHDQPFAPAFLDAVREILGKQGFGDYETCTTPYYYRGWSDQEGGPNKRITYNPPSTAGLVTYAADSNITEPIAKSLALPEMPDNVRRALAENPTICSFEKVTRRLIDGEDIAVCDHVLQTCPAMVSKLTHKEVRRFMSLEPSSEASRVKMHLARYLATEAADGANGG